MNVFEYFQEKESLSYGFDTDIYDLVDRLRHGSTLALDPIADSYRTGYDSHIPHFKDRSLRKVGEISIVRQRQIKQTCNEIRRIKNAKRRTELEAEKHKAEDEKKARVDSVRNALLVAYKEKALKWKDQWPQYCEWVMANFVPGYFRTSGTYVGTAEDYLSWVWSLLEDTTYAP